MRNKIKDKLINEINSETPDILDNILLNCKEREIVMETKTKKSIFMPLTLALASILLVVGFASFQGYKFYKTDAIIELDVNPSIQLKVNSKRVITEAIALNEDGKKILSDMNLKNSDLNVGVNAIIGSMLKEGYISELKNSILISVNSKNQVESNRLQKELSNEVDKLINAYSIKPSVVTQKIDLDDEIERKAKKAGISEGKAEYIEKIIESNLKNKNGEPYTFETLAGLSINELNVILNSKNKTVKNTNISGKASTKSYITKDNAKNIALTDAGINDSSIRDYEIELDYEYGKMIYEISFDYNGKEFEYEIDAITGDILNNETDIDDVYKPRGDYVKPSNNQNNNTNNQSSTDTSANYIGLSNAKSIALANAGASASQVRGLEAELDIESGKAMYDVSFEYKGYEYDYEIDAISGRIIKKDVDKD